MRSSLLRGAIRRAVLVPVVLAASLVLAGCFSITGQSTSQVDVVGDLVVTTEMCTRTAPPLGSGTCEAGLGQDTNADNQFFVAHLVSDWVTAPATIQASGTLGALTLTASPQFAAAVGAKLSPGAGRKWIAYASTRQPKLVAGTDYRLTATARLGVPAGSASTMELATVTGWRVVRDAGTGITALPIDRAINCDEVDPDDSGRMATSCAVSALPGTQPDSATTPANAQSIELSTLAIAAPASVVPVTAGQTASIAFAVAAHRAAGAPASVSAFASTTVPGATPMTSSTIALEGQTSATVQVPVPAGAAPGDYDVVLSGANGARSATATLRVSAAPTPTPAITPTPTPAITPPAATPTITPSATATPAPGGLPLVGPQLRTLQQYVDELAALLKVQAQVDAMRRSNVFDLPLGAPSAGTLQVRLTAKVRVRGKARTQVLARGSRVVAAPGGATVKLVPTRIGARVLNAGKPYKGTLRVQLKTSAGVQRAAPVVVAFG